MSSSNPGPLRPYEQLEICTTCFRFTGPVIAEEQSEPRYHLQPTTDGGRVVQLNGTGDLPLFLKHCDCQRERGDDAPLPGPTTWRSESGTDFEVCWTCALTPMRQNSRFAHSVCDHCRPVIKHANEFAGRLLFPVARHSIVNSAAAARVPGVEWGYDPDTDPEKLVAEARNLCVGIDRIRAWQSNATRLNLQDAGLFDGQGPAHVPVLEYFAGCERAQIDPAARAVQLVRSTGPWA